MQSWLSPIPVTAQDSICTTTAPQEGDCGQRLWFFTLCKSDFCFLHSPKLCLQYFVPLFTILHGLLPLREETPRLHCPSGSDRTLPTARPWSAAGTQRPGGPAWELPVRSVRVCGGFGTGCRARRSTHSARRGPWSAGRQAPPPRGQHISLGPPSPAPAGGTRLASVGGFDASGSGVKTFFIK